MELKALLFGDDINPTMLIAQFGQLGIAYLWTRLSGVSLHTLQVQKSE